MRKGLLALGIVALASWAPSADAATYCSDNLCASRPENACFCPPGTDKAGEVSNCQDWNSIQSTGCWYFQAASATLQVDEAATVCLPFQLADS